MSLSEMAPKVVNIILLLSVARYAVLAETSNQSGSNSTFPISSGEHNDSSQNINIKFDYRKPVVIQLETDREDVVESELGKLESKLLRRLDDIEQKLDLLAISTCSNSNVQSKNITTLSPAENVSLSETDPCKETIFDRRNIEDEQLRPLPSAEEGAQLKLAFKGDGELWIYLSREQKLDTSSGLYFKIWIGKLGSYLYVRDAGDWDDLEDGSVGTDFTTSQFTQVWLTIADDGSLKVRVGDASASPLLVGSDSRLSQMKYFGLEGGSNSEGFSTYSYNC